MSSVERRERDGKLSWRAHYRTPEGRQRNKTFSRKIDADRFLTSVESTKLTGSFVDPLRARITVGELAAQWMASKVNLKASTRARYQVVVDLHVVPRWGDVAVSRVDHDAIQTWVSDLVGAGKQSGASVRKMFAVLSAVLDLAVRTRRIPMNPAKGVSLPRSAVRGKTYLTAVQVEAMADAAGTWADDRPRRSSSAATPQYRLAVLVLAYTGLRWSELAALKAAAVDLDRARINVSEAVVEIDGGKDMVWGTPKNHQSRTVRMPDFLVDELRPHLAGKAAGDLVFTAPDGGVLRNRNARRDWFDRAAKSIGVPGLTPHGLRHTAASLAVSSGANVKAVQRMLGHASAAMTLDVYSDLFDDDIEAVAKGLGALRARAVVARALPGPESAAAASVG